MRVVSTISFFLWNSIDLEHATVTPLAHIEISEFTTEPLSDPTLEVKDPPSVKNSLDVDARRRPSESSNLAEPRPTKTDRKTDRYYIVNVLTGNHARQSTDTDESEIVSINGKDVHGSQVTHILRLLVTLFDYKIVVNHPHQTGRI